MRHKKTLNVYNSGSNKHLGVVFALNNLFKQPLSFKKRIFQIGQFLVFIEHTVYKTG